MSYPRLIESVIDQLIKLPGIGRRSAERIAFWFLNNPREEAEKAANGILKLKDGLRFCVLCNNFSETEICPICRDPGRDRKTICVVENPKDLLAIEQTRVYRGLYFVLLGAIAPTEGRGPDDLHLEKLIKLIKDQSVTEVIIATDADTEGEMTALHIQKVLKPLGLKLSRIGLGLPVGSSLEYADLSTLTMSMTARKEV